MTATSHYHEMEEKEEEDETERRWQAVGSGHQKSLRSDLRLDQGFDETSGPRESQTRSPWLKKRIQGL